ncbi:LacI family DNA-binding transcriptional regulator [bacterium]|nr:LacI family DNA-binding transcriptional regulator [bacterium]
MATLKEIARRANVSIGTVDRVIHNRGNVSSKKEAVIRKIIEDMDYKPNLHAQQLQKNKKVTFGVLMPESNPRLGYWPIAERGIEKAREELSKHNVRVEFFPYDANSEASFLKMSSRATENGIDGLLIAPGLYLDVIQKFTAAIDKRIPYVFFDSPIQGTRSICNILQDAYQSGRLSARLMHLLLPDPGTIAIITVSQIGNHLRNRAEGFLDYFRDKSGYHLHLFCPDIINSPMHDIDHVLERLFDRCPGVRGIFATNALVYKIVDFLNIKSAADKKLALIGYDLTARNTACIKNGLIDFLISQKPEIQSYRGIYSLYRHVVLKESIEEKIMMPLDIVTRENIGFYQNL